jgi:hypothetical protein
MQTSNGCVEMSDPPGGSRKQDQALQEDSLSLPGSGTGTNQSGQSPNQSVPHTPIPFTHTSYTILASAHADTCAHTLLQHPRPHPLLVTEDRIPDIETLGTPSLLPSSHHPSRPAVGQRSRGTTAERVQEKGAPL